MVVRSYNNIFRHLNLKPQVLSHPQKLDLRADSQESQWAVGLISDLRLTSRVPRVGVKGPDKTQEE